MKKIIALIIVFVTVLGLSGCAFFEIFDDNSNVVDLGASERYVRWSLVENDNEYSTVESAYFEFNSESFKYYEDGALKKEGTHRITYLGVENTIAPLHINLDFGKDESGLSIFDYLDCYTEDEKDNLSQFTLAHTDNHKVDFAYRLIVGCAVLRNLALGNAAIGDMDILWEDIYVF
mgnify:CR=1 FL=1